MEISYTFSIQNCCFPYSVLFDASFFFNSFLRCFFLLFYDNSSTCKYFPVHPVATVLRSWTWRKASGRRWRWCRARSARPTNCRKVISTSSGSLLRDPTETLNLSSWESQSLPKIHSVRFFKNIYRCISYRLFNIQKHIMAHAKQHKRISFAVCLKYL